MGSLQSPGRRQLSEAEKQELRLNQLASLGYADTELNTKYLAENNGNVAAASSALQRHYAEVRMAVFLVGFHVVFGCVVVFCVLYVVVFVLSARR